MALSWVGASARALMERSPTHRHVIFIVFSKFNISVLTIGGLAKGPYGFTVLYYLVKLFCRNKSLSNQGYLRLMLVLGEGEKNLGFKNSAAFALVLLLLGLLSSGEVVQAKPTQVPHPRRRPKVDRSPTAAKLPLNAERFRISVSPRKL